MVAIVIPFYNEGGNIFDVLKEISTVKEEIEWILVDNGSTDCTRTHLIDSVKELEIKNSVIVLLDRNLGYGYGIKVGLEESFAKQHDVVGWTHGDGQTAVSDVVKAYRRFQEDDSLVIVKGRRKERKDHFFAIYFTQIQNILLRILSAGFAVEPNAQPTLVLASVARTVYDDCPNDGMFDLSFLLKAASQHKAMTIARVPVVFKRRLSGKGSHDSIDSKILFSLRNFLFIVTYK